MGMERERRVAHFARFGAKWGQSRAYEVRGHAATHEVQKGRTALDRMTARCVRRMPVKGKRQRARGGDQVKRRLREKILGPMAAGFLGRTVKKDLCN